MDDNFENAAIIIKYLDDEMSADEKAAFEKQLKLDAGLYARLESLRLSRDAISYYGINEKVTRIRMQLEETQSSESSKKAKIIQMRKPLLYNIAVAATVILVLIGLKTFWLNSVTPEKIYQQTYVSYSLGIARSGSQNHTLIEKAWQQKDYEKIIQLAPQSTLKANEQLLLGLSYLEKNQLAEAITQMEKMQQMPDKTYSQDIEFYLSLAYLKNKEFEKSLSLLKKIRNNEHHLYHNQVTEKTILEVEKLR
ncbi:MAG: hypothetical protein ABJA85_06390 [Bacteroidota bacterium]